MDGEWRVYVHRYDNDGTGQYKSWTVRITPGGDLDVASSIDTAKDGESGTLKISWTPVINSWKVGAVSHNNGTELLGLTVVNVDNRNDPNPNPNIPFNYL